MNPSDSNAAEIDAAEIDAAEMHAAEMHAAEETDPAASLNDSAAGPRASGQAEGSASAPPLFATTQLPSARQLAAARAAHWHQDEKPLLSLEAVRAWLNQCGLVAFGARAQQLGAPGPSFVEATLGRPNPEAASLDESDAARTLLTRLIAEGSAVPLNLLGASGGMGTDVPDHVASAAVFSYIFTLRGNKAWKQMPVTSGPVKVSPLALAAYEILSAKVTLSAYDLATQLGKEVTEGAVLRALTELWTQLRVIPVPQLDGSATLWELASSRFTKQIKAGANAGQPSALSALISLYLGQAVAATEDEIETFLSPLAPRSRVRDVIHALLSARQLETVVVEGRTLLHVAGELPGFAVLARPGTEASSEGPAEGSRISKFASKPGSKIGTGLRSKPGASRSKPAFGARPAAGGGPDGGDRERRPFRREGSSDSPRRPFSKPAFKRAAAARPAFDKPWAEKAQAAPPSGDAPAVEASGDAAPRGEFAPRREFKPRNDGAGPRKTFSKPGTFGRKREGAAGSDRPSFGRGEGRPPRRDFEARPDSRGGDRSSGPSSGGFKRSSGSAGSYTPRPRPGGESSGFGGKPSFPRKPAFGGKPPFGDKPRTPREGGEPGLEAPRKVFRKFDAPRDRKPFTPGAKPFAARPSGDRPARSFDGSRPERSSASKSGFSRSSGPPSDRPRFDRSAGPGSRPEGSSRARGESRGESRGDSRGEARSGFGGKPAGKSGGSKPFARAGGPFAKFADGKKPFRKPGPGKPASSRGSSGTGADGGYRPSKRRKPGEGA